MSATFASQTNLVVWDAAHGIEHFVRDARFLTKGKDLGFIAPTPSRPSLSAVASWVFDDLESLHSAQSAATTTGATTAGAAVVGKSASVSVVETKDVAGYRATVLRATDPASLQAWLHANGYPAPPFIQAWAAPYVRKGWYLTAFKVEGGADPHTGPIRMSFATKTPFSPYSVPAQNGRGGHVPLRLYYLSKGAEVPRFGGTAAPWRSPEWSIDLLKPGLNGIAWALKLPAGLLPAGAHLSVYRDDRFGTPGLDDLYFVPKDAPERSTNAGLLAGGGLGGGGGRRVRARPAQESRVTALALTRPCSMGRHLSLALVLFPSLAPACMGIGEPGRSVRFAGRRTSWCGTPSARWSTSCETRGSRPPGRALALSRRRPLCRRSPVWTRRRSIS